MRFQTVMRDAAGRSYALSMWAPNEKAMIVGPNDVYAGQNEGDVSTSGNYQVALRAKGQKKPIVQKIKLYGDGNLSFNLNRNMIYVLKGQAKNQPDVLVVEQYGTSNGSLGVLYFVSQGSLQRLRYFEDGKYWSDLYTFWSGNIQNDGAFRFRSQAYDNSQGTTWNSTWIFEPKLKRVRRIKRTASNS